MDQRRQAGQMEAQPGFGSDELAVGAKDEAGSGAELGLVSAAVSFPFRGQPHSIAPGPQAHGPFEVVRKNNSKQSPCRAEARESRGQGRGVDLSQQGCGEHRAPALAPALQVARLPGTHFLSQVSTPASQGPWGKAVTQTVPAPGSFLPGLSSEVSGQEKPSQSHLPLLAACSRLAAGKPYLSDKDILLRSFLG